MTEYFDLVVVGGGVAALWLTRLAAEQGARTVLVTAGPLGSHASTRAQGWLHSGGFYAAYQAWDLAQDCVTGSADIRALGEHTAATLTSPHQALFLTRDSHHASQVTDRWLTARIAYRAQPNDWARPGFTLADTALDMRLLITVLADQCRHAGATIAPAHITEPPVPNASGWVVDTTLARFHAGQLVLGLGAALRDYLHRWGLDVAAPDYRTTHTNVLVIQDLSLATAVIPLFGTAPTLVPIWQAGRVHGVTACLPLDNVEDRDTPIHRSASELLDECVDRLPELARRLTRTVRETGWVYSCQKLLLASQSGGTEAARSYRRDHLADNLTALYAGKLTTASVAARALLETLPLPQRSHTTAAGNLLGPLEISPRAATSPALTDQPRDPSPVE